MALSKNTSWCGSVKLLFIYRPNMDFGELIKSYTTILHELNPSEHIDYMSTGDFISGIWQENTNGISVEYFLEKLKQQLGSMTEFARACLISEHLKHIVLSSSPINSSPAALQNAPHPIAACEAAMEEQIQAPSTIVPHQPIIAANNNGSQTPLEALRSANGEVGNPNGSDSPRYLAFGASDYEAAPVPDENNVASDQQHLSGRDFIMKKIGEHHSNKDAWDWFKTDDANCFFLKNYLVVVDQDGKLLSNPEEGDICWDPNQEIYIQSEPNAPYPKFAKERPLVNNEFRALYPSAPFFKAFAYPEDGQLDENGAGASKEIKDCSYPVFTVETADGCDFQQRIMVLVVTKSWLGRKQNPDGLFDGVWPQSLQGLKGKQIYLKIRFGRKSCYYYGEPHYKNMWPIPPANDDSAGLEETPLKRQRTAPARFVAGALEINNSTKEMSIKLALPETLGLSCWTMQGLREQSVGPRDSGVFSPTKKHGFYRLDLLAIYKLEGTEKCLMIMIECDDDKGHQTKNSEEEMKRAVTLAQNHSEWRSTHHLAFLRINPDICSDFNGQWGEKSTKQLLRA